MKHIFFIQSQITKLIALGVIEYLKIPNEEVVILAYRGIDFYEGYTFFDFPFCHNPKESFPISSKFWEGREKLKELDQYIINISDNCSFILYIPHIFYNMINLMGSHHLCEGLCLLEEGKTSFSYREQANSLFKKKSRYINYLKNDIYLKLNYGNRLKQKHIKSFFPDSYLTAYKFSDAAFPDLEKVIKIPINLKNNNNKIATETDILNTHILVLEPLVEAKVINIEDYLIGLGRVLMLLKHQHINNLYYKFHPDQQDNKSINAIIELFQSFEIYENMKFKELEKNVVLEEIACQKKASFYSIVSSLLYYAWYLGSQAYSFANLIPKNAKIDRYLKKQPQVFLETLEYVDTSTGNISKV
ncbi:unknown [Crocosphaera subtropica ATCC 51142]|uniref:Uncharacterized protein n=1 Tax=Crocosphaera subtropica (strain ATCC 51142 / BH68) TaxID=43989 RepID=B1WQK3_CROS5|nr:hypothetical protein [Crocosphaera subtropica]ACB51714.1 unknown [Crocosphaera subtropica ATCC 51142]